MHAHLVAEPVQRRSGRSHVVAFPKFVLVSDSIHHGIEAVNIGPNPNRFFLDAGIDFGDGLDFRVD